MEKLIEFYKEEMGSDSDRSGSSDSGSKSSSRSRSSLASVHSESERSAKKSKQINKKKIAKLSSDSDSARSRSEDKSSTKSILSKESHQKKVKDDVSSVSVERVDSSPPLGKDKKKKSLDTLEDGGGRDTPIGEIRPETIDTKIERHLNKTMVSVSSS